MFMHIGKDVMVDSNDVVFVISINNLKATPNGRDYYEKFMEKFEVVDISGGTCNTLVIMEDMVYVTNLRAQVIWARFNNYERKMRTLLCYDLVEFDVKSGKIIGYDDVRLDRELDVQEDDWG